MSQYVYVCETGEYFPDGHFDISSTFQDDDD